MDIHFALPDLASLDQLKTEVLCLPVFEDERPLRGTPGLVDWRLCGRVSELLVRGTMTGAPGEAVLMSARPRLMAERLMWVGGGSSQGFAEPRFRELIGDMMQRLLGMRLRSASLVLPGRARDQIAPAQAIEWFLDASQPFAEHLDELTLLDSEEARRVMAPLVERARRRALAEG
jgi:hypothetical protein